MFAKRHLKTTIVLIAVTLAWSASAGISPAQRGRDGDGFGGPGGSGVAFIDIAFEGGTLKEYVDLILSNYDEAKNSRLDHISIVVPPQAENVLVNAVELKNTHPLYAMQLLSHVSPDKIGVHTVSNNVIAVTANPPAKTVETYKIGHLIRKDDDTSADTGRIALDDLVSAVETALELSADEGQESPKLRMHAEAGLMFVKGTKAQQLVIGNVVDEIGELQMLLSNDRVTKLRQKLSDQEAEFARQASEIVKRAGEERDDAVKKYLGEIQHIAQDNEQQVASLRQTISRLEERLMQEQVRRADLAEEWQRKVLAKDAEIRKLFDELKKSSADSN